MSYYYTYNFTSPEGIYATVKEELKSYFDSGAIDDLMFPTYLDKCLKKLGRSSYVINEEVLFIEDFQGRLPDNFHAVREAWMCTEFEGTPYQTPNSFYSQSASATTIQVAPMTVNGESCIDPVCQPDSCDECLPNIVQAVYKTNGEISRTFIRRYLLKPGNISVRQNCDVNYLQNWNNYFRYSSLNQGIPYSSTHDSFDIRDNKFVTNFRTGIVDIVFYATDYDIAGNQLVPDNYRITEYIEAFIKYKMFEQLLNIVTDETFIQIEKKVQRYEQKADEAYTLAASEVKRQTSWEKQRRIKQSLNRFNKYELPSSSNMYRRRRNS